MRQCLVRLIARMNLRTQNMPPPPIRHCVRWTHQFKDLYFTSRHHHHLELERSLIHAQSSTGKMQARKQQAPANSATSATSASTTSAANISPQLPAAFAISNA